MFEYRQPTTGGTKKQLQLFLPFCNHSKKIAICTWHMSIASKKNSRFGRYFFDSCRVFPTATEFFRQLPNFTISYRILPTATLLQDFPDEKQPIFPHRFLCFYLKTAVSCLRTSHPLSPTPRTRPPRSRPPILPCWPRRAPLAAAGHLHKSAEFHRHSNRILATVTEFFQQRYRILPQLPNFSDSYQFADKDTEF